MSQNVLHEIDSGIGLLAHGRYLCQVYTQVVKPMTKSLKELMYEKRLLNEAEMFCTDLEFRVDDQYNIQDYIGDLTKKNDDIIRAIQERLNELVLGYRKKLREIKIDGNAEGDQKSKAFCVWFATYFRMDERATNAKVQPSVQ